MSLYSRVRDTVVGALAGGQIGAEGLRRAADSLEESVIKETTGLSDSDGLKEKFTGVLESAFAELELAFEDVGWRGAAGEATWNFTRATLRRITGLSRVMYLINPLIKRAVTVQELYVWGRGVKIKGETPIVNEVLMDFFKDPKNQRVIGASWAEREREQRLDGNTFFTFYRNRINGTCRVRLIPFEQVETVIYNPEDSKEPWFYCRTATTVNDPIAGLEPEKQPETFRTTYYPDIHYNPRFKPAKVNGIPVEWDAPVFHLKTGGLSMMRFGIPELFSTLNWATGYKRILENFATILAAYARLAMQVSGLGGKKGVAATKAGMQTGVNSGRFVDNNPPKNTAGWAMLSGGAEVKPIKTAGSTTGPDEARALRSMVAAGSDTPEHFFGDSDVGNFATSSTLDRPTELKMIARQKMWVDVIECFCNKLIEWSAASVGGKLHKAGYRAEYVRDRFDGTSTVIITAPNGSTTVVNIEFPNILERDVTDRVRALVQAVTLGGSPAEGIFPDRKVVCRWLTEALGEQDAERITDLMYPVPVTQGFRDPADMAKDESLIAQGKKELGDAALQQAAAAKVAANKPAPRSGSPASGASNK